MIDISRLRPVPHHFKSILKKHKISIPMAAKYLRRHPVYIGNMLNGYLPMSKPVEAELQILIDQLE